MSPIGVDHLSLTRKITLGAENIIKSNHAYLYMGNIDVERNWGHAEDYLELQWLMLHLYVKDWMYEIAIMSCVNISLVNVMFKITCSVLVFIYSLYVGQFATGGDQANYIQIYEKIGNLSFNYYFYFHRINTKEIVHFVFSFIFSSNGIDKDLFVAISNGVLAYVSA